MTSKNQILVTILAFLMVAVVGQTSKQWLHKAGPPRDDPEFYVSATVETEPLPSYGDAADDPAVWYNASEPALSTVIGTDKDGGLAVYDLSGKQLQYLPDGQFNNVDIRAGFSLAGQSVALVTAGNRGDGTVGIYKVNAATRLLENVASEKIKTVAPYGSCMYRSPISGKFYYIVNSKAGIVEQWQLFEADARPGEVKAKKVRTFSTKSGPEGCVADDESGYLYIAEQEKGIWRYGAEPEAGDSRTTVDTVGPEGHLARQVEGLAIYYLAHGRGYLVVSSQNSNEFVLYKREGNNDYVHTLEVRAGNGIDEVTHTDGLDVTSHNMGPQFPEGFLVVQDHLNDEQYRQNFKLVPWHLISKVINPSF